MKDAVTNRNNQHCHVHWLPLREAPAQPVKGGSLRRIQNSKRYPFPPSGQRAGRPTALSPANVQSFLCPLAGRCKHRPLQMLCDVWLYGAYVRQHSGPSGRRGRRPLQTIYLLLPYFLCAAWPCSGGVRCPRPTERQGISHFLLFAVRQDAGALFPHRIPCKISTTSALSCQRYTDAT